MKKPLLLIIFLFVGINVFANPSNFGDAQNIINKLPSKEGLIDKLPGNINVPDLSKDIKDTTNKTLYSIKNRKIGGIGGGKKGESVGQSQESVQNHENINALYEKQIDTFKRILAVLKENAVSDRELMFYIKQRNSLIHNKNAIFATQGDKNEKRTMCNILYGNDDDGLCPF